MDLHNFLLNQHFERPAARPAYPLYVLGLTLALLLPNQAISATLGEPPHGCAGKPGTPMYLVMALIDQTGSVTRHTSSHAMLQDLATLVQSLPAGFHLYIRFITADSYNERYMVYHATVPAVPAIPKLPDNPYNRQANKAYRKQLKLRRNILRCARQARQAMQQELSALVAPASASKQTDLYGALIATDELFAAYDKSLIKKKLLVIWSDLQHTRAGSLPRQLTGLRDTQTIVRTRWNNKGYKTARALKNNFNHLLEQRGLPTPQYLPMQQTPFTTGLIRVGILDGFTHTTKEN